MITIANPIYDVVFKYLMEDERIARTIAGTPLTGKHTLGVVSECIRVPLPAAKMMVQGALTIGIGEDLCHLGSMKWLNIYLPLSFAHSSCVARACRILAF